MVWNRAPWEYTKLMSQAFLHEELELKQHFLEIAREYRNKPDSLENELAAALLYMNLADYLAEYLVQGLSELSKEALDRYYMGFISVNPPKRDSFSIGNSIKYLERYDFPKRTEILSELEAINKARVKIAHQMLKVSSTKLNDIDVAVTSLFDHTEQLVLLIDAISVGLPPPNYIDKYMQQSQPEPSKTKSKDKKSS